MASITSPLLKIELQTEGENEDDWGDKANENWARMEQSIAGFAAVNMAGSGDRMLSDTQYLANEARRAVLILTGALNGASSVTIPARSKLYNIKNSTTGDHPLTILPLGGTGVVIPQGTWSLVYCAGLVAEQVTFGFGDINRVEGLSQADYNALGTKVPTTLYLVPIG